MKPWKRIEPTEVTQVGWRAIVRKQFVTNLGKTVNADIIDAEGSQSVSVIALTKDKQVIIARQFRAGPELVMDELPGGGVDKDEPLEAAARRELLEETSYDAGEMHYLGKSYKEAWHNATWHFYLATDCTEHPQGQQLDPFEDIEVALISIEQLIDNAKNARMTDAEAVLFAYDELLELKNG